MTINDEHLIKVSDKLREVLDNIGKRPIGISTGIPQLDDFTRGLKKSELIVVAGRPGMGKSSLMLEMILAASKVGKTCLIFTMEMPASLVIERMLSNLANISMDNMEKNNLLDVERKRLDAAATTLFGRDIFINDSQFLTTDYIRETINIIHSVMEKTIDLVCVDYLQLMVCKNKYDNREGELNEITSTLKAYAGHYKTPFVLISQLNREAERRESKRPAVSDLRGSGSIEQSADAILLLYRPGYYLSQNSPAYVDDGETEIIVAKQRNSASGVVKCIWDGTTMSFSNRNYNANNIGDI